MKRKSSFYINLIGWIEAGSAEFIFVTFSKGLVPQYNCVIKYKFNSKKRAFEVDAPRFENLQINK